jgi:hypothetical protein
MSLTTRVAACICPGNFVATAAYATPSPIPLLPLYVGTQDFFNQKSPGRALQNIQDLAETELLSETVAHHLFPNETILLETVAHQNCCSRFCQKLFLTICSLRKLSSSTD